MSACIGMTLADIGHCYKTVTMSLHGLLVSTVMHFVVYLYVCPVVVQCTNTVSTNRLGTTPELS